MAVKAIRHLIANEEEFLVKRKVTCIQAHGLLRFPCLLLFQAVEKEFNVWFRLRHRNVLPLYGMTNGFGPLPAFVCPWADNGTLSEYLEKFETKLDLKRRMTLVCG